MLLNNSVAGTQSQTGAVADRLGGVKRVENAIGLANTGATIDEIQHQLPSIAAQAQVERATALIVQRLNCIFRDVRKDLEQPVRISPDSGKAGLKVGLNANILALGNHGLNLDRPLD